MSLQWLIITASNAQPLVYCYIPTMYNCKCCILNVQDRTIHNLYKDEMRQYKTQYNVVKEQWNVCKMFNNTLLFQNLVQAPCIKILYYSKVTLKHTTMKLLQLILWVATYIKVRNYIMYGRVTNSSRLMLTVITLQNYKRLVLESM